MAITSVTKRCEWFLCWTSVLFLSACPTPKDKKELDAASEKSVGADVVRENLVLPPPVAIRLIEKGNAPFRALRYKFTVGQSLASVTALGSMTVAFTLDVKAQRPNDLVLVAVVPDFSSLSTNPAVLGMAKEHLRNISAFAVVNSRGRTIESWCEVKRSYWKPGAKHCQTPNGANKATNFFGVLPLETVGYGAVWEERIDNGSGEAAVSRMKIVRLEANAVSLEIGTGRQTAGDTPGRQWTPDSTWTLDLELDTAFQTLQATASSSRESAGKATPLDWQMVVRESIGGAHKALVALRGSQRRTTKSAAPVAVPPEDTEARAKSRASDFKLRHPPVMKNGVELTFRGVIDPTVPRTLLRGTSAFAHCFRRAGKNGPTKSARLTLDFDLSEMGKVKTVVIPTSDTTATRLHSCMRSTAARMRFVPGNTRVVVDVKFLAHKDG